MENKPQKSPDLDRMEQAKPPNRFWANRRIGITGASGTFGRALTQQLRAKGAVVVGLTHSSVGAREASLEGPHQWVQWQCGQEIALDDTLAGLDVLVLNHGINPKGRQGSKEINDALEVNALSTWRLMQRYETIAMNKNRSPFPREIWVNTSEAEIQPALSPAYEISKRLIGQLASLRRNNLDQKQRTFLTIRKLVLGPFRSQENPLRVMSASFVASLVIKQVEWRFNLIIVTPNPLAFLVMPLVELYRGVYARLMRKFC